MAAAPARILIVENDLTIAENLYAFLELKGFLPDAAYGGHAAVALLGDQHFDAMVLDIGLPGMDGYAVLQALQRRKQTIPVLMLTARSQLEDKLAAFSLGAQDYLVKPFALEELEARLRVLLGRARGASKDETLEFAGIEYDIGSASVTLYGQPLHLTHKSRAILEVFMRHPAELVSRRTLELALWADGSPSPEALRSQIHLLRKALLQRNFDGIQTVPGLGWKLVASARQP
ncbi:response regulator transcription factor [Pollutimonas bauzanensis]|uniref:DNA-binding response regulator, OmpR family, contains REC and winged-helix (WHTH) domain n=1 Tax=Pollutimonas bauzanensis TaxID=658167 RepID=A0A1M5SAC5_9BURK|nr:response regulator transcription factor [Pollutimonas bauzanensis]SHH35537.1 DNA-binding response regulator, OmpR family, contains REC and winged-helix (wHTH) domain [Pollutimonas bauzanensis]